MKTGLKLNFYTQNVVLLCFFLNIHSTVTNAGVPLIFRALQENLKTDFYIFSSIFLRNIIFASLVINFFSNTLFAKHFLNIFKMYCVFGNSNTFAKNVRFINFFYYYLAYMSYCKLL